MSLIVQRATTDDVERLTECLYAAFQQDAWGQVMFPSRPPPGADTPTKRRYRKQIESDPNVTVMKVVDAESGDMAGFARWEIYLKERPESEWKADLKAKREWDEGTNAKAANHLVAEVLRVEEKLVAGKPHCCLGLLDIHPDYQRRGAGGLLVEWGTDIADKHGLPCFLAASPMGLGLYRRHGFEDVGENTDLDMSRFGGEGIYRYVSMLRPAKKTPLTAAYTTFI